MGILDNIFARFRTPAPAPRTSLFDTIGNWFNNPRANYTTTGTILPINIISSDGARKLFVPPPAGRPPLISILDKSMLPGLRNMPAIGPRQ